MDTVLANYLPPDPDTGDPPFLWGDPDVERDRLGSAVENVGFETVTVLTPVSSPVHYWQKARTEEVFIVVLEAIDDADHPALREGMIEAIDQFFDTSRNVIPMEYRRAKATVRQSGSTIALSTQNVIAVA